MIRKVVYFSMQVPNRPGVGANMLKMIAKGRMWFAPEQASRLTSRVAGREE